LRGLTSDNWAELSLAGKIVDYFWHLALPLIALSLAAFATTTLLTKNSFIDEIRKQYVTTARAKGLSDRQVLYGHVFRNAMLIVIAGFPGAFISAFFTGSLLIETIFSLDGLGLLGFESVINRDYPVVFATLLHLLADGPAGGADFRPDLHLGRSAHRLREKGGLTMDQRRPPATRRPMPRNRAKAAVPVADSTRRRWAEFQGQPARLLVAVDLPDPVRRLAVAEFIANDRPILVSYKGEILIRSSRLSGGEIRRLPGAHPTIATRSSRTRSRQMAG
jgi:hypothetical protein